MKIAENVRDYLWWIPLGAILFLLWPLIGAGRALAAATAVCVFSVVISEKWDRRFERRFWLWLGGMALAHVLAIALIPFGKPQAGIAAVPFGLLDLLAMMAILHWAEKRLPRPDEQSGER